MFNFILNKVYPRFKQELTKVWYVCLSDWGKEDKIRTCYLYTCYCYINEIVVVNAVLRECFYIDEKNKAIISRIIKATMELDI